MPVNVDLEYCFSIGEIKQVVHFFSQNQPFSTKIANSD